jgi:FkbM family methyltransferase
MERGDPLRRDFFNSADPDDVFLDVGANFGSWTMPAAGLVRRVYSIEPSPGPYLALLENIGLNDFSDRVRALPVVVGESAGFVRFRVDSLDSSTATSHVASDNEEAQQPSGALWRPHRADTLVPSVSIDGLVESQAIESPTLVKIDTEGYEGPVLRGMARTAPTVRVMFVEVHPDRLVDEASVDSLRARIDSLGFRVVNEDQRGRQIHLLCERRLR